MYNFFFSYISAFAACAARPLIVARRKHLNIFHY